MTEGNAVSPAALRVRALRHRRKLGQRRFYIDLTEDEIKEIAKRGYFAAATSFDPKEATAQAVQAFISDVLFRPVE